MKEGVEGCLDDEGLLCDGVWDGEALALEEHAGVEPEVVRELVAAVESGVAVVAYDRDATMEEVATDLVVASAVGPGLNEGEVPEEVGDDAEAGGGLASGEVGSLLDWLLADPLCCGWAAVDNGVVGLLHLMALEGTAQGSGDGPPFRKEEDSACGAVESVDGLNLATDLVAQNLHRHEVAPLGMVGGVHELARWLVDGYDPVVLVEYLQRRVSTCVHVSLWR